MTFGEHPYESSAYWEVSRHLRKRSRELVAASKVLRAHIANCRRREMERLLPDTSQDHLDDFGSAA
jgi:hypothetical protein